MNENLECLSGHSYQRRFSPVCSLGGILLLASALAACSTTVSQGVNDDGTAQQVVFPDPLKTASLPEGSFPTQESLRLVQRGLSKSQVYQLVGVPHFEEGFGAREWDYIFHLNDGKKAMTCQFKLIFDSRERVGSLHWQPQDCASLAGAGSGS